eukprot:TRINITY_DN5572_c0_g1_i2.p1 TRINITY_DN5572_c0_g1~~TRINITY_DN5572_c0_g1_i2.p1  ORF type:complete len:143 (-),score=34.59 TRINITY_DN5572_c0_g1_i2:292-720(-)
MSTDFDFDFIDFLNHLTFDNERGIEALDFESVQETQCFSEDAFSETASLTDMSGISVHGCFNDCLEISQTSRDSGIDDCSLEKYHNFKRPNELMEKNENVENIVATNSEGAIDEDELLEWFLENLPMEGVNFDLWSGSPPDN